MSTAKGIVYRSHETKLATNARRRVRPFDATAVPATITDTSTAVQLITGDMVMPGELEARILLGIAAAVEEQRRCGDPAALTDVNVGVRLGDEPWTLLDLVLVAYHVDPTSTPLAAVAELMLVFKIGYVGLFGRVASLVDVFEAQYEVWSQLPPTSGAEDHDDDDTLRRRRAVAANQFRYACALNAMRKGAGESLDHFCLAYIAASSPSASSDDAPMRRQALTVMLQLLRAKAKDDYRVVSPRSGVEYELVDAETVSANGQPIGVVVPKVTVVGRLFGPDVREDRLSLSKSLVIAASFAAAVTVGVFVWVRLRKPTGS